VTILGTARSGASAAYRFANKEEHMASEKLIYWHRELPPLSAQVEGEHTVQATSEWVAQPGAKRDELWALCYENLMAHVNDRVAQEIKRLHGSCAHVLEEDIKPRIDNAQDRYRLEGTFTYVLYCGPQAKS
jgi:hypothetical protein